MKRWFCDVCNKDITDANIGHVYRLLLDRDAAPFDECLDIHDVCEDCAKQINQFVTEMCQKGRAT